MGIKRCPYCRALIEEGDVYCRNCGTQLLFPEDEMIEENIPGEKIIWEPEEEEQERVLEEEKEEEMEFESQRSKIKKREKGFEKFEPETKKEEEIFSSLIEKEEKPEISEEEASKKVESELEKQPSTIAFSTQELDRLTGSVDDARKDVEEFLRFLKGEVATKPGKKEFISELTREEEEKEEEMEPAPEEKSELPPWAEAIKDRVETEPGPITDLSFLTPRGFSFEEEEKVELEGAESSLTKEEVTPEEDKRPPWQTDSGVGLPEKPGQRPLPFSVEPKEAPDRWEEEEISRHKEAKTKKELRLAEREGGKEMMEREEEDEEILAKKRPSRSFKNWLKAKFFDFIFIGFIWFVAFVLAARIVAKSFFSLVGLSLPQAVAFFLILFLGYFFLFRFFIGETLGDRLFSSDD